MVQGRIDAKRQKALGAARSFGSYYSNAVRDSAPELIRYRAPDKAETPNIGEPGLEGGSERMNANAVSTPAKSSYIKSYNSDTSATASAPLTLGGSAQFDGLIRDMSAKYGVDANLIKSVMKSESNFNTTAVSGAGAMGLMQLMPGTAREMGVTDPYDPAQNIEGGVKYLRKMLDRFDGDVALALAAYNCGPNRVENLGITSSANTEQFSRLAGNVQRYAIRVLERAGYTLGQRI